MSFTAKNKEFTAFQDIDDTVSVADLASNYARANAPAFPTINGADPGMQAAFAMLGTYLFTSIAKHVDTRMKQHEAATSRRIHRGALRAIEGLDIHLSALRSKARGADTVLGTDECVTH